MGSTLPADGVRDIGRRVRPGPYLSRGGSQPLTPPSVPPRTRYFWKTKNMIATGIVISSAPAMVMGYCEPEPSWPLVNVATPLVSVK